MCMCCSQVLWHKTRSPASNPNVKTMHTHQTLFSNIRLGWGQKVFLQLKVKMHTPRPGFIARTSTLTEAHVYLGYAHAVPVLHSCCARAVLMLCHTGLCVTASKTLKIWLRQYGRLQAGVAANMPRVCWPSSIPTVAKKSGFVQPLCPSPDGQTVVSRSPLFCLVSMQQFYCQNFFFNQLFQTESVLKS